MLTSKIFKSIATVGVKTGKAAGKATSKFVEKIAKKMNKSEKVTQKAKIVSGATIGLMTLLLVIFILLKNSIVSFIINVALVIDLFILAAKTINVITDTVLNYA